MRKAFRKNLIFFCQEQRRRATTEKAGSRLMGNYVPIKKTKKEKKVKKTKENYKEKNQ